MTSNDATNLQQMIREVFILDNHPSRHSDELIANIYIIKLVVSDSNGPDSTLSDDFDQVAYTIKTILQMGKEKSFSEQLTQFIDKKEIEIEKMCNFHYQVTIVWKDPKLHQAPNITIGIRAISRSATESSSWNCTFAK